LACSFQLRSFIFAGIRKKAEGFMIESVINGIGLGIALSFATGPVFFALIKTSIERGFYAGVALAGGVVLSDLFYVIISVYGSTYLNLENKYRLPIGLAGALVLTCIGVYYWRKKVELIPVVNTSKRYYTAYFFKGFLMSIFNPGILLYWATVTTWVVSVPGKSDSAQLVPFYAAILTTQFCTDTLKAFYSSKLRHKITEKMLTALNRIAGSLMLVFAVKILYDLFFKR
jgi:amino acid exporter